MDVHQLRHLLRQTVFQRVLAHQTIEVLSDASVDGKDAILFFDGSCLPVVVDMEKRFVLQCEVITLEHREGE